MSEATLIYRRGGAGGVVSETMQLVVIQRQASLRPTMLPMIARKHYAKMAIPAVIVFAMARSMEDIPKKPRPNWAEPRFSVRDT